jgi:hypothetical protein
MVHRQTWIRPSPAELEDTCFLAPFEEYLESKFASIFGHLDRRCGVLEYVSAIVI